MGIKNGSVCSAELTLITDNTLKQHIIVMATRELFLPCVWYVHTYYFCVSVFSLHK